MTSCGLLCQIWINSFQTLLKYHIQWKGMKKTYFLQQQHLQAQRHKKINYHEKSTLWEAKCVESNQYNKICCQNSYCNSYRSINTKYLNMMSLSQAGKELLLRHWFLASTGLRLGLIEPLMSGKHTPRCPCERKVIWNWSYFLRVSWSFCVVFVCPRPFSPQISRLNFFLATDTLTLGDIYWRWWIFHSRGGEIASGRVK